MCHISKKNTDVITTTDEESGCIRPLYWEETQGWCPDAKPNWDDFNLDGTGPDSHCIAGACTWWEPEPKGPGRRKGRKLARVGGRCLFPEPPRKRTAPHDNDASNMF